MSEDLENEIEAIQSIYGDDSLQKSNLDGIYVLSIPNNDASLRLSFPKNYTDTSPEILGTEHTGEHTRKGYGKYVVDIARETLRKVFVPGSVCLFDLLQELDLALAEIPAVALPNREDSPNPEQVDSTISHPDPDFIEPPNWILSTPHTEKKSTFLARACAVDSPNQAKAFLTHLLDTDKRAAKATHNITAYRIRAPAGSASEIAYQDCDDDGETAAGGRLLHLLQVMDVWGVLVVLSRWYGGVKLGPDRLGIINSVAREAVVKGGWARVKGEKG